MYSTLLLFPALEKWQLVFWAFWYLLIQNLGVGNGSLLQYSRLEISTDRGAWRAAVCGAAESDAPERLSTLSVCPYRMRTAVCSSS